MKALLSASLLLLLLLAACSGGDQAAVKEEMEFPKYRYAAIGELTREYVSTSDGSLRVLRPEGWLRTSDPKNAPSILLWLVREDYSASLSFSPIKMDPGLYQTLRNENLTAVAKVSLSLKERNAEDSVTIIQPVELFKVGGRICAAYEYRIAAAEPVIRVVVFDTGTRFMECVLYPASVSVTPAENRRLFELQQSVLASLLAQ
jgi:hypothetical protein